MPSLKIGFLINDEASIPAWYAETIKTVLEKGYAVWFVRREKGMKADKEKQPFLFRLFQQFEERWFRPADDAMKPFSVRKWLTHENSVNLNNAGTTMPALDVLYGLSFSAEEIQRLSPQATHGLWWIGFGYDRYAQKHPPAFWEVMDDSPVTGSCLLAFKDAQTFIVYDGTTRTVPYSVKNNFGSVAWKASSYLPQRLAQLEKEKESFFSNRLTVSFPPGKGGFPGNVRMAFLFARNLFRYAGYKWRIRNTERFTLLYATEKFELTDFHQKKFVPLKLSSANVFYADPFVIEKDGVNHIFFEEMDETRGKAHISCITVNQNKEAGQPQIVLDKPYHLSYPFVFLHNGQYYMIPETASNKTVELYKAERFPDQWKFVMNLRENVVLFDATLHYEDNKWWLFAAGANHPAVSTNDQLFLFYSDDLFSTQWTPHPQNPVATHAANCRPAGRIFQHNNKLYRQAQNNASPQYGYGLKLNEIEVLSEDAYREKEILSIEPEMLGLKACHHLDFSSSLIVMDGIPPPS